MKTSKLILLLALFVSVFGCRHLHDSVSTKADPKYDYAANGYIKAMVIAEELDGCKFMLQAEDGGKKMEPDEIAPAFQKDSLKVWLKYQPDDNRMSICMMGQPIKVLDIRTR